MLLDRPIQVGTFAPDLDVGLIDAPACRAQAAPLPAQPFLDLRGISLNPAVDRRVIDRDAALPQRLREITLADPVPTVLPHRPEHDLALEVTSFEIRHGSALLAQANHDGKRHTLQQRLIKRFDDEAAPQIIDAIEQKHHDARHKQLRSSIAALKRGEGSPPWTPAGLADLRESDAALS